MPPRAAPPATTGGDNAAAPSPLSRRTRPALAPLPAVQVGTFEGPLDLILHLVRAGQMDIFDLPIATLCAQYMAHLNAMEEMDLSVAGEFLVMAATLLEIKSRLLLPPPPKTEDEEGGGNGADGEGEGGPEDPRAELVRRLLEYGKYQGIAEGLKGQEEMRRQVFFRGRAEYAGEMRVPPRFGEMSAEQLLRTLERMLETVGAGEKSITSVRRQKITLRMKMREVLTAAERAGGDGLPLGDVLPAPPFPLIEVVLLFLALLELLKVGSVLVAQEDFCGEIRVFFVPEAERRSLTGEDAGDEPGITRPTDETDTTDTTQDQTEDAR